MRQRERKVAPPGLHKAAGKRKHIDHHGEQQPRPCNAAAHPQHHGRQWHGHARIALARDRGEAAARQHPALHKKHGQGKARQHQRQGGCHTRVECGAHNGKKDFGREHRILPAHDDGVAKVGHAFDEADQERIRQPGLEQRQRDCPECLHAAGTQGLRGLLHRRAHALHHTAHDHEGNGREGKHLRQPNSEHAIKPARGLHAPGPFQGLVEQTGPAK